MYAYLYGGERQGTSRCGGERRGAAGSVGCGPAGCHYGMAVAIYLCLLNGAMYGPVGSFGVLCRVFLYYMGMMLGLVVLCVYGLLLLYQRFVLPDCAATSVKLIVVFLLFLMVPFVLLFVFFFLFFFRCATGLCRLSCVVLFYVRVALNLPQFFLVYKEVHVLGPRLLSLSYVFLPVVVYDHVAEVLPAL